MLGGAAAAAVGLGLKPRYGELDPYRMAASAIDEALRNVVAIGADPARTAILDNFCWGDPKDPVQMGALAEAARACYELSKELGAPFISGKDSLNNTFEAAGKRVSIPPTLLVSALSILPDAAKAVTLDLKGPGHPLYLVGLTRREMGGSHFYAVAGGRGMSSVDPKSPADLRRVARRDRKGGVLSCHHRPRGLRPARPKAIAGRLGLSLDLSLAAVSGDLKRDDESCFPSRMRAFSWN